MGAWKQLSPPLSLVQGKAYSALLRLSWAQKALATAGMIEDKLEGAGFGDVTVDMNAANGPQATGTWISPAESDVSLPEEVVTVWEWQA